LGIAGTFKALSDGTRREILSLLTGGSMTAGEIGERFSMTGATISHHLSVLKQAGLVSDEKKGKYVYYELNTSMIDELMRWTIDLKEGTKSENEQVGLDHHLGARAGSGCADSGCLEQPARSGSDALGCWRHGKV